MLPLPSRMDFIWVISGPLVAIVGGRSAREGGFGSKQKRDVNDLRRGLTSQERERSLTESKRMRSNY